MKKKIQDELRELSMQLQGDLNGKEIAAVKQKVILILDRLTILEYLEGQIGGGDPLIGQSYDSKSFREQNWFVEPEPVPRPDHQEDLVEPLMEKIKDIVAQMPEESQQVDELLEKVLPKKKIVKNDLEEFASNYQEMPVFEKKDNKTASGETPGNEAASQDSDRPRSINESINTGLQIGLNDRIAFIKHLFEGKAEDYTRVLSQINSLSSLEDAESFIKTKVEPEYESWAEKEAYVNRFMSIVEKNFN